MEKFRNLTNNIFFKVFLAFVGLTFIVFGVSDFIMGSSNSWIAKVGGEKISYQKFNSHLKSSRERIYRANPDERVFQYLNSQRFRIDSLNNMVTQKLIALMQEHFAIFPDKELLLKSVIEGSDFRNADGDFDRNGFINYLRMNGMSEEEYVSELENSMVSNIIVNALSYQASPNKDFAQKIFQYKNQKRKADIIKISINDIKEPKNPTRKELLDFFEENKKDFSLPQYRQISYIEFFAQDILPEIKISQEQIIDYYHNSSLYINPVSRNFYHLVFDEETKAAQFLDNLDIKISQNQDNSSQIFLDLALGAQDKEKQDIILENVQKEDLLPEIVNDVFALKVGENSKIIASPLGYHIFYLIKENPQSMVPLTQEIRDEIADILIKQEQEELLVNIIDQVDDQILTSNSLEETAKKFSLKVQKTPNIDKNGFDIDKNDIASKIALDNFVKNAFNLPLGETSELLQSDADGKYYALFVDNINPARDRALDEVTGLATDLLHQKQRRKNMVDLARSVHDQIKEGKNIKNIVKKNGLDLDRNEVFSRSYNVNIGGREVGHSNKFLQDLFAIKVGQATNPHIVSDEEIHIGILRNIIEAKKDQEALVKLKKEISDQFQNDIFASYDNYLQNLFPIEINDKLLNQDQDNL